jgi:uncharacterized protein (DUF3084 family)
MRRINVENYTEEKKQIREGIKQFLNQYLTFEEKLARCNKQIEDLETALDEWVGERSKLIDLEFSEMDNEGDIY